MCLGVWLLSGRSALPLQRLLSFEEFKEVQLVRGSGVLDLMQHFRLDLTAYTTEL